MSFDDWWRNLKNKWAFPSDLLNNQILADFVYLIAKEAYKAGGHE